MTPALADQIPGPTDGVGPAGSQAVLRSMALLSTVGRSGDAGLGLSELATQCALSRPTARRLLLALSAARMVEQDPVTRRYRLGPETFLLATFATDRHGILAHARASLDRIAAESHDSALLTIQQDDHAICLHRVEGSHPVRSQALLAGDRHPLGVGAGSLAILAAMSPARAEALLQRLAPMHGALHPQLREDVARARQAGYALNPGRIFAGSWGLGVVACWPDGRPAAALSVAAIDSRMTSDRVPALVALLQREARVVEASLAGMTHPDPISERRPS